MKEIVDEDLGFVVDSAINPYAQVNSHVLCEYIESD